MFFMMGITPGRKDLEYNQVIICDHCGAYGRYQVYMTYMCLSLFFVPCIKWNKQYFVQTTCCSTIYELDAETGKSIARGNTVTICPQQLKKVQAGHYRRVKHCKTCGFHTEEDYEFCPKCGNRF